MPNISQASRSSKPADGHRPVTVGSACPSASAVLTRRRWPWVCETQMRHHRERRLGPLGQMVAKQAVELVEGQRRVRRGRS